MSIGDLSLMMGKVEGPYGVYVSPTPAADSSIVFGYEMTAIEGEDVRREIERGFHGTNPSQRTAIRQRHRWSMELTGAGTADGEAHWAKYLRGCQFAASVADAGIDRTYPLIGVGDGGSMSLAGNKGNAFDLRGRGARGNMTLRFVEKQLPSIAYDFMALHQDPVNIITPNAPAGVVLPTYPAPKEVSLLNTVVTFDGLVLGVRSFEMNLGAKVEYYSTTAVRQIVFGKDQEGSARSPTATVVFELPDPSLKNYFADILAGEGKTFSLTHGLDEGNIVKLGSTNAILANGDFTPESNRLFLSGQLQFVSTAAGNDFELKTK